MKKIYFVLMLVSILLVSCNTDTPVFLSAGTKYTTGYSTDGELVVESGGKSISFYPRSYLGMTTYQIKNGNELWGNHGKVAKIKELKNGNIRIYDCATNHISYAIGHTWKRK